MQDQVVIKVHEFGEFRERGHITVKVNDVFLGEGYVGGEPEDNTLGRQYCWIKPLLIHLAYALRAEVAVIYSEE